MSAVRKKKTTGKRAPTFADVRKIALSMPEVEETMGYGMRGFRAGGTRFAGEPVPRPDVEPGSIWVGVSFDDRERLIASRPDVYYVTKHFAPYPAVLARLKNMSLEKLQELLALGWHYAMERKKPKKTRKK